MVLILRLLIIWESFFAPTIHLRRLLNQLLGAASKRFIYNYSLMRNCLKISPLKIDLDLMFHLFDVLIQPILEYGVEVWGSRKVDKEFC